MFQCPPPVNNSGCKQRKEDGEKNRKKRKRRRRRRKRRKKRERENAVYLAPERKGHVPHAENEVGCER
jgi:hypothetical protein